MPKRSELQFYINQYLNFHEIAEICKCSDSVVSKWVTEYDIYLPPDYKEKITRRYIDKGMKTVVDKYGVFPYALAKYPKESQQIITNRNSFEEFISAIPLKERTWPRIAAELSIPIYLAQSYYTKHGLYCKISNTLGSSLEEQLRHVLDSDGIEYVRNDRTIISPQEVDFYIPNKHLGIEVNGNWSHSVNSVGKYAALDRGYHAVKTVRCKDRGVRLIHLFEYEMSDTYQWHRIEKFLLSTLSNTTDIYYARRLDVKLVNSYEEKEFLEKYHLQGYVPSKCCYGLFHNDELLSLMSFGRPRFSGKFDYELLRLCTKFNCRVVGGAEKLFKQFIRSHTCSSIISYCDLSKFTGEVYTRLGMELLRTSPPNYKWVKNSQTYSRYQTQKHKLLKILGNLYDSNLTEEENMIKAGYVKIYDCGNAVYEWRRR